MGTIQDNRIRFPPTLIDFVNDVGTTGQDHDNFPAPGQARYDWMRIMCIGLLSLQSSEHPPTQYRIGTLWYDRLHDVIKVWSGTDWTSIGEFIQVGTDTHGDPITLNDQMVSVNTKLLAIQPRMTYSGYCIRNAVTQIPVPTQVLDVIGDGSMHRPLVYINGFMIDPRKTNFVPGCPSLIVLSGGVKLNVNNYFTVIIEHFDVFVNDDVIAS